MRANYDVLPEIFDVVRRLGISNWMLSDIHPTTAVLENVNVHVSYNVLKHIVERTIKQGESYGVRVSVQGYPLCILGENFRRSQEVNLAWYTQYVSEYPFGSEILAEFAPFASPSCVYN